jgi:type IV fimbrial biogenesis protein FimT
LVHLVHQARQASLATGKDIVLCPSANGRNCVTDAQWDSGWLMFSNTDSDHPPDIDSGETILATEPAFTGLRVLANRSAFVIRPHGLRSTNGTLVFCSRQADIAGRRLIVSYTGKPRTALMNSADSQTVCGRSAS